MQITLLVRICAMKLLDVRSDVDNVKKSSNYTKCYDY
jgi:hypothetical protein